MKAGHVVSIRVNPRDCQSVLDILDAVGYPRNGITFAQCVSLALGSLLETARKSELIPEPDEFEYLPRMQPYLGKKGQRARIANELHSRGGSFRARDLASPRSSEATDFYPTEAEGGPEPAEAQPRVPPTNEETARFTELLTIQDARQLSPREQAEYDVLLRKLYPDG